MKVRKQILNVKIRNIFYRLIKNQKKMFVTKAKVRMDPMFLKKNLFFML